jgi:ribonuclease VapC
MDRAAATGTPLAVSAINVGEVFYRLHRKHGPGMAAEFLDDVRTGGIPLRVWPAANRRVWHAARLKARYPISYADAFAAALAQELRLPLVTGDREFCALEEAGECRIDWLA